jgi:mono/diheme cytochrome c family protein
MSTCTRTCTLSVFLVAWLAALATTAAQTIQSPSTFLSESLVGKDSFEAYCASCHGTTGHGDGPVAASLRNIPTDLTALARRNGNSFPREQVTAVLMGTGRTVAAHGTTAMPIWGPMFRMFESDARAKVRIDNLVCYVETLQVQSQQATDAGKYLFRVYCAVCHGVDARGGGPLTSQLRSLPPSLTSYAVRNSGVFRASGCEPSSTDVA